jgi:ferredoxin-NADP reductase
MHVGDIYSISAPRNLFPLDRDAAHSVLIAGGIGITPMISMAFELGARQQPFDLYYAFRSADERIPLGELENLASVHFHDDMASGSLLDIPRIVDAGTANSHFYCCGPKGMLTAFESSTASLDAGRAHVEYFSPKDTPSPEPGFTVELALTGREFFVPPGMSILDVLRDAGVDVSSSCEEGICGACETQVIEGDPLHRDSILTKAEQSMGKKMMICCSGCKGDRLVLHL